MKGAWASGQCDGRMPNVQMVCGKEFCAPHTRWLVFASCAIAFLGVSSVRCGLHIWKLEQPIIICDNPACELGKVREGEVLTRAFTIRNAGWKPLTIEQVKSSCLCTSVLPLSTHRLAAGESFQIEVQYRAVSRRGAIRQVVMVQTNDPDREAISLAIRGEVTQ
jgi:Protein of unknown function (DUF1573)